MIDRDAFCPECGTLHKGLKPDKFYKVRCKECEIVFDMP